MVHSLEDAVAELNEDEALRLTKDEIQTGEEPRSILEALSRGMEVIKERFEKSEYGLAELHMATELFNECVKLVEPRLRETAPVLGRIVMGKVIGRREDFSREPVAAMLKAAGFEVYDLGEDISGERFVGKAREVGADIVGICGLETTAVESAKDTIAQIRASGVRAKILVGAGMLCGCSIVVDDKMRLMIGADAAWNGLGEAVSLAKSMVGKGV